MGHYLQDWRPLGDVSSVLAIVCAVVVFGRPHLSYYGYDDNQARELHAAHVAFREASESAWADGNADKLEIARLGALLADWEACRDELHMAREARGGRAFGSTLLALVGCYSVIRFLADTRQNIRDRDETIQERDERARYLEAKVCALEKNDVNRDWAHSELVGDLPVEAAEQEAERLRKRGDLTERIDWMTKAAKASLEFTPKRRLAATEEGLVKVTAEARKLVDDWLAGVLSNEEMVTEFRRQLNAYDELCHFTTIHSAAPERRERVEHLVELHQEAIYYRGDAVKVVRKMREHDIQDNGDLDRRRDLLDRLRNGENLNRVLGPPPRPGSIFEDYDLDY